MTVATPHVDDGTIVKENLEWMLAAAALSIPVASIGHFTGPFDATSTRYGANWPGDWVHVLASIAAHLVVLGLIILPRFRWRRARQVQFALVALVFGALGLAGFVLAGHAGRLVGWHHVWVVGVGIAAITTASRERRAGGGTTRNA